MTTVDENTNSAISRIEVSEFETRFAETMHKVVVEGEDLVITENGTPISRLTKYRSVAHPPKQTMVFGQHRDQIHILGDIVSPMPVDWYGKDNEDEDLY